MQVQPRYPAMTRRMFAIMVTVSLVGLSHVCHGITLLPATAGEVQLVVAQQTATQDTRPNQPTDEATVTRGMGKEAVRAMWGAPEEIRRLRTCFGWQEEWVYRGDPKRFGASERVLLFDEGEVLIQIK